MKRNPAMSTLVAQSRNVTVGVIDTISKLQRIPPIGTLIAHAPPQLALTTQSRHSREFYHRQHLLHMDRHCWR